MTIALLMQLICLLLLVAVNASSGEFETFTSGNKTKATETNQTSSTISEQLSTAQERKSTSMVGEQMPQEREPPSIHRQHKNLMSIEEMSAIVAIITFVFCFTGLAIMCHFNWSAAATEASKLDRKYHPQKLPADQTILPFSRRKET